MVDALAGLVARLGQWGYLLIFAGALLESAALVGVLVPGEALVLVAGFFAAQGVFDLDALMLAVALGATCGDSLGYELGRHWGRDALLHHGRRVGLTPRRLDRVDRFFERHGGASVFLGRFVGFARALVPFLAGASRMPYGRFLAWNAGGAVLWSVAVVLLGYFLGASWHRVQAWIGAGSAILAAVLGLGALFHLRPAWRARLPLDMIALAVAVCLLGTIVQGTLRGDAPGAIAGGLARWLAEHRGTVPTTLMLALSQLHGRVPLTLAALAFGVFLFARRRSRWLVTLVAVTAGGALFNVLLDAALRRAGPDPHLGAPLFGAFGPAGGQVASATLLYGGIAAYAASRTASARGRVAAMAAALAAVAGVAFARLYLGEQGLREAMAAFTAATAWLTLCLIVFQGRLGDWTWARLDPAPARRAAGRRVE